METEENYVLLSSSILIAVVLGGAVFVLMYILKVMKSEQKNTETEEKNVKDFEQFNARKDTSAIGKKKKNTDSRWTNRTDKQGFSHPWLLTSLKGHTGQVLDMDFASNGKYLASCADEEPDPGDDLANGDTGGSSSGSECNKENSRPSSADPSPRAKPLSRRQRKNRRREDSSSPENKKKSKGKKAALPAVVPVVSAASLVNTPCTEPPKKSLSEQYDKLGIDDADLSRFLRSYLLSPEQMLTLGYPVDCASLPGRAIIFKSPIEVPSYPKSAYKYNKFESKSGFDVNAREFVPNMYRKSVAQIDDNGVSENSSSGHDSGNSSDSGENDSEESSDGSVMTVEKPGEKPVIRTYQQVLVNGPERNMMNYSQQPNPIYEKVEAVSYARTIQVTDGQVCQRTCVRCNIEFYMNSDNTYITQDACFYHWGKLTRVLGDNRNSYGVTNEYMCCGGKQNSRGCTQGKLHVWYGLVPGFNGPFDNYVRTRLKRTPAANGPHFGVYSLDCEMCFTSHGLELVKISVVTVDGRLIYDVYVKPENEIVDYNSRFSGITAKDMHKKRGALKTLREVQNDLMGFVTADTILIGHGLENDLRALRIIHPTVIDTAVSFPHYNGLPYRRSLKSLISCFLKREIQTGHNGHNSYEDARACMDLMLWRVRKDFRSILDHSYHF